MEKPNRESIGLAPQPVDLDERRLLQRHVDGDSGAFEELVHRYETSVYGYLVRCAIPPEARDDLFQEVFTRVHAAAATYRPEHALKAWLFTIVVNTVRTWYRRRKVRRIVFSRPDLVVKDPNPDALRQVEVKETTAWLEKAIRALPALQREVVILSCIEQLPHEDIAMALGLPVNTVKTHLRRARQALAAQRARTRIRLEREVSR